MLKQTPQRMPKTPKTMLNGVGLPKSSYRKKDQRQSNESAIQAIAITLAGPCPEAQELPCCNGALCKGHVNIYTASSAEVLSLDDNHARNFARYQQHVNMSIVEISC